jgi:DNA-directed RNA polymerase subunit RPC12/RpoP
MFDIVNFIWAIIPFIFGLVAITLIPSKEKINNKEVEKFSVEVLLVVYMIALLILILGFYYFMSIFSDTSEAQLVNIFNGVFLEVIALGIMGVNYRNYSLFSDLKGGIETETRVHGLATDADVLEVAPVEAVAEPEIKDPKISTTTTKATTITGAEPKSMLLRCPKCGNTISVEASKRPIKIHCPHCGVEGIIN